MIAVMKFYYKHYPEQRWAHRFVGVSDRGQILTSWRIRNNTSCPEITIPDIYRWLKENFGPVKGRYRFHPLYLDIAFEGDSDAMLFKLKWVSVITDEEPWDTPSE